MVQARAWCRVDLAGGTLDIWPLGLLVPGARTVSVAVDLPVTVKVTDQPGSERGYVVELLDAAGERLHRSNAASAEELVQRPETALVGVVAGALSLPAAQIEVRSASPRGGGLGASSAMAVALIAAMEAARGLPASSVAGRAAMARDLEAQLMRLPTGTQDHYAALLGGVIELSYPPGGVEVQRLPVDEQLLAGSLLVAYTGQSHFSAGNNWQVIRRFLDGDLAMLGHFQGIAESAAALRHALASGDLPAVGRCMSREWSFRRQLAPQVSTPQLETQLAAAIDAGAWGGKACGAGGGGCIAVLGPPEAREVIAKALVAAGAAVLPAAPTFQALEVSSS